MDEFYGAGGGENLVVSRPYCAPTASIRIGRMRFPPFIREYDIDSNNFFALLSVAGYRSASRRSTHRS